MLYEALTGRVPFDADSPVTVALKQVSERPRPPSELNPAVSRALDAVVLRALAKDPANRFASAEEFLQALDVAEQDPSGAAFGDTASYAAVAAAAGTAPPAPAGGAAGGPGLLHAVAHRAPGAHPAAARGRHRVLPAAGRRDVGRARAHRAQQVEGRGDEDPDRRRIPGEPEGRSAVGHSGRAGSSSRTRRRGRRRRDGSIVTITYSIGLGKATVPDVKGMSRRRRREAAEGRGLPDRRRPRALEQGQEGHRHRD